MRATPALELQFPASPQSQDLADLLLVLLDDLRPVAIDEGAYAPGAEQGPPRFWRIYFTSADDRDDAARVIRAELGPAALTMRSVDVEDEDWVERSQAQLTAIRVGRVVVAPPWDPPTDEDALVVTIRPSMGFGTGHHASTRLCLRALQRIDPAGRSVVDVGTGSGVLAIAAVKLGAVSAVAFDCDPDALANARENVEASGVADRVELHAGDLADVQRLKIAPADIVLANLTAGVLQAHAGLIGQLTAPRGSVVVSGILTDQVAAVESAFGHAGLSVSFTDREGDWMALTLRA